MLEFAIRIVSVIGAVWVSLALFYTEGEQIILRLWWEWSSALGIQHWALYLPVTQEKLASAASAPGTGAALGALSILCFVAAMKAVRKPKPRRRRWPGATQPFC